MVDWDRPETWDWEEVASALEHDLQGLVDRRMGPDDVATRRAVREEIAAALRPDPHLTVSECADQHRELTSATSAEPGRWRTSRTPYLREIMDALGARHPCREVTLVKGSQVGGTEVGNNWLLYIILHQPGPVMVVLPDDELLRRFNTVRLKTMIEACPALQERVHPERSREAGNSMALKSFKGGVLVLANAGSAAALKSTSARFLFLDELDSFPEVAGAHGKFGSPVELALRSTMAFSAHKVFRASTPSIEGRSPIWDAFLEGDQSVYEVPCPRCSVHQRITWANIRYEDLPEPMFGCRSCGSLIPEHEKLSMLAGGRWTPACPERSNTHRSFHLSALCSPWFSWQRAVDRWRKAQGAPSKLRVFVNEILGEDYQERGDAPEWRRLYERREPYTIGVVPERACVLTMGVDVQKDRLEMEIVGWGRGLESWSVDYLVIPGDPADPATWRELERVRTRSWPHESGSALPVLRAAIDSNYATGDVYRYVRGKPVDQVMAVQGPSSAPMLVSPAKRAEVTAGGRRRKRGVMYWPTNSGMIRSELYGWLRLDGPTKHGEPYPPGYCHFPHYGAEYFRQLTALEAVPRVVRGVRRYVWEKVHQERDEANSCRIYARAAAFAAGLDRWDDEDWAEAEDALRPLQEQRPRGHTSEGRGSSDYWARW